ncbi:hypothetical protein [Nocardia heshunensis]
MSLQADAAERAPVAPTARFDRLTSQAPHIELALLERLSAAAYPQADAAVRVVAAHGGIRPFREKIARHPAVGRTITPEVVAAQR